LPEPSQREASANTFAPSASAASARPGAPHGDAKAAASAAVANNVLNKTLRFMFERNRIVRRQLLIDL
jgi:hypothetical protein